MKEIFLKFILCKKIERQELKFLNLKYVFFATLLFFATAGYLFLQCEEFLDMQSATPEQLQSIIHDTPCAGDALRIALQTNTGSSSESLTFGDAKKMASECKDKEEFNAVREKQLNALNDMSK